MWPILVGLGIATLIAKISSDQEERKPSEKKKIFISFAIEDEVYRDYLVEQAKNERSPFSFVDMSVKRPWSENEWKLKCREKIKKCDGMIVMLSSNTFHSSGARWEIKCAKQLEIPVIGMHIKKNKKGAIPPELKDSQIIEWTWENLKKSINKI